MSSLKKLLIAALGGLTTTALVAQESPPSVTPHGVVEDAGWALSRLNDGASTATGKACSYRFAESSRAVRLYLIDSAVSNESGWFAANSNLTFAAAESFPAGAESSEFGHGTRMLSIIAGPDCGAARGIPVELHSYDIYNDGDASNLGLLVEAILRATTEHEIAQFTDPDVLGVVCIANGTGEPARSPALLSAIDQALGVGLVVVVSAGNDSTDTLNGNSVEDIINGTADAYLPAAYGSARDGLICVGATTSENTRSPLSNYGEAIDLDAPGENVLSFDPDQPEAGQTSPMQGTSPAAALATAAAIIELSRQPDLDPAGIEAALKERLHAADEVSLVQTDDDLDDDGAADELERFFGYAIDDPASVPGSPSLEVNGEMTELSFTIAADLWNPEDPMNLSDSSAWRLVASTDLQNWTEIATFIEYGEEKGGRLPVTALAPKGGELEKLAIQEGGSAMHRAIPSGQRNAADEVLQELYETQKDLFPEWYWEILGLDDDGLVANLLAETVTVTPTTTSGVYYRIEIIPNP